MNSLMIRQQHFWVYLSALHKLSLHYPQTTKCGTQSLAPCPLPHLLHIYKNPLAISLFEWNKILWREMFVEIGYLLYGDTNNFTALISELYPLCLLWILQCFIYLFIYFCLFLSHSRGIWRFQARGWIWATAAVQCHSHSNEGSEPHLWPTLQLTATPDP